MTMTEEREKYKIPYWLGATILLVVWLVFMYGMPLWLGYDLGMFIVYSVMAVGFCLWLWYWWMYERK